MLDAVRTALDLLGAAPKDERKLIVVFSDGIDVDMDRSTFTSIGKRAREAGVVIDTIGSRRSSRPSCATSACSPSSRTASSARARSAGDISTQFNNVIDEIKKQYVATFEVPLAGGDGKDHVFQATAANSGREQLLQQRRGQAAEGEPPHRQEGRERLAPGGCGC